MDENNQFGSFGSTDPEGMAAIRDAMARRGIGVGTPALEQQSASSATQPGVPPEVNPVAGVMPAQAPQTSDFAPEMAGVQAAQSVEAEIILKAMADRLRSDSKIRESQTGLV